MGCTRDCWMSGLGTCMCGTRRGSLWSAQLLWGCCSHSRLSGAWVSGHAILSFSSHHYLCLYLYNNDGYYQDQQYQYQSLVKRYYNFLSRHLEATSGHRSNPVPEGQFFWIMRACVTLKCSCNLELARQKANAQCQKATAESLSPHSSSLPMFHQTFENRSGLGPDGHTN
jgi:hypothetical protein